ncbi:MAG: hypothetical protein JO094_03885 [Hyphomicrobiales bacterium]|nr:hypothetical protein [Hyphomicrobiales bacterium]MBV8768018.1 hypothetical protein [Hyphomicrobiales bacterium]MBV9589558.1 hypothetical protein [Hyphomicrobiales bacterium]MBV9977962.1 hypothetical protein [Hyphomicrobiales bacterium]
MSEHDPPGERLVRLETQVQAIVTDMAFIKGELKPITEAFQQAKGFKGAVYLFAVLLLVAIGAGFKDVVGWILTALKP